MKDIHTVLGTIRPEEIGVTYSHDHLLFCVPPPYDAQDPDLRLDSIEAAIQEITFFKAAGGKTIVEMSTVDAGRSPEGMRRISETTGIHIVAATGYNKSKYCEQLVAAKSCDQLADDMVKELIKGMDNTAIKAGLIKASSSLAQMTPGEEKVFQAAAIAHRQTGAPISTHTEAGTMALEQVRLLVASGVAPEHIVVGHLDRKLEWDYLLSVAQTGVFMIFDQLSKEKYYPDALRISMLKKLIDSGYSSQMLLSGDLARKSYWPSYGFGNGPGLTYILWRFVPWMVEAGITRAEVEKILIDNPARAFSWA